MVDYGPGQGRSDCATAGGVETPSRIAKSENAGMGCKTPFLDGHYLAEACGKFNWIVIGTAVGRRRYVRAPSNATSQPGSLPGRCSGVITTRSSCGSQIVLKA